MSNLPEPRQIAEHLIRQWVSEIGEGNVRGHLVALRRKAGIKSMPVEKLVTEVHDLIGTAEITWPGPIVSKAYINGDDGYPWLTCSLCQDPLTMVEAGDLLGDLLAAVAQHTCAEGQVTT
jgi:hypothetical protein